MKESKHQSNKRHKKKPDTCYNWGKPGHIKRDYHFPKKKNKQPKKYVIVISEVNALQDDDAWWIDCGATRHVCKDKKFLKLILQK